MRLGLDACNQVKDFLRQHGDGDRSVLIEEIATRLKSIGEDPSRGQVNSEVIPRHVRFFRVRYGEVVLSIRVVYKVDESPPVVVVHEFGTIPF